MNNTDSPNGLERLTGDGSRSIRGLLRLTVAIALCVPFHRSSNALADGTDRDALAQRERAHTESSAEKDTHAERRVDDQRLPPLIPGESVPDGSLSPSDRTQNRPATPRRSKVWTTSGAVTVDPPPSAPELSVRDQGASANASLPDNVSVIIDRRDDSYGHRKDRPEHRSSRTEPHDSYDHSRSLKALAEGTP